MPSGGGNGGKAAQPGGGARMAPQAMTREQRISLYQERAAAGAPLFG